MTVPAPGLAPAGPPGLSPLLVPRPYRVIDKIQEVADIHSLHVVPIDGPLPVFEPAQIGMLGAFGVGEAAISVSSATANADYHAYTIRRAGPITGALVDTPVGGVITIRGPFGRPWPLDRIDTGQLLIVGGGLGIAPLRAVIHGAVARLDRLDRVALVYGAKRPDQLVYRSDLAAWEQAGVEVSLIVDEAAGGWDGAVGVVPSLLGRGGDGRGPGVEMDWGDTTAFVCGPDVMMHFTATALERLGMSSDRIWLTFERNMQCGNALCGHCQLGPFIVCRDGPVASYAQVGRFHQVRGL
jgi:NAD(P)H-flavin reductase